MTKGTARPANWETFEVLLRRPDGTLDDACARPYSAALAHGGILPTSALTKMRMLKAHGWPAARSAMLDDQGQRLIVRPDKRDPAIWELKCKPKCWRLYFYVYENSKRFLFLLAICKKKHEANVRDATNAHQILEAVGGPSGSGIILFEFPSS